MPFLKTCPQIVSEDYEKSRSIVIIVIHSEGGGGGGGRVKIPVHRNGKNAGEKKGISEGHY